jgi:predicted small secreted protein
MLALGAAVVIISYLLPSNETSRKKNLKNIQRAKNQAQQVEEA